MSKELSKGEILERLQHLFTMKLPDQEPSDWDWPDRGSEYKIHELINDLRRDLGKDPLQI